MRAAHAAETTKDGPPKSTRGQLSTKGASSSDKNPSSRTTGPLDHGVRDMNVSSVSPTLSITLSDCRTLLKCPGRCDGGSDDTLVSHKVVEAAVLKASVR